MGGVAIIEHQKMMRQRTQYLRKNATKEENKLWYQFLKNYPVQFKRQYQVGYYIVDFYCYRAKLIVELDGSQHCEQEAMEYDKKRTQYLSSQGYYILRISNLDIQQNFRAVCAHIDRIVQERNQNCSGSNG